MTPLICRKCKTTVLRKECKWHDCKSSLIDRIKKVKNQQRELQNKLEEAEKSQRHKQEPLSCYLGHPIREFRDDEYEYTGSSGDPGPNGYCKYRTQAWDDSGFAYPTMPSKLICQSCQNNVEGIDRALYTCDERCDFDFCPQCATCKGDGIMQKHIMQISYLKPQNTRSICGSFQCSRCKRSINDYEAKCGYLRCDKCEIYVCRQCITRPKMQ